MSTWADGPDEHDERVQAHVDGLVARYREQVTRAAVAAGIMRGHFGPDGSSFCVGHFASQHRAVVGGRGQCSDGIAGDERQADED